ncbi:MAG: hypothetical protein M1839_006177 [Geoglossum umbratile]|nr:MAG: hypothetical protein M1839_006177 [Geoglossum umbratile]
MAIQSRFKDTNTVHSKDTDTVLSQDTTPNKNDLPEAALDPIRVWHIKNRKRKRKERDNAKKEAIKATAVAEDTMITEQNMDDEMDTMCVLGLGDVAEDQDQTE